MTEKWWISSVCLWILECYFYFMSHLSIGFFLPLKSYVEGSSPIFSFHFLTRKHSVNLEFGRRGLGGCHDVVKSFRAFMFLFIYWVFAHVCLFPNFRFYAVSLCRQRLFPVLHFIYTLKGFLILLSVFLLVNVQPVFYPIPTGGTWGPTDGMFVNECGTDAAVPVTSLLCWWTPRLSCRHSVSFPRGLGRSALHLFPSVFYLVAMENECVNSIEVFCYKPRC